MRFWVEGEQRHRVDGGTPRPLDVLMVVGSDLLASPVAVATLLTLVLTPAFWPSDAFADNGKIGDRGEICEAHRGTSLWGRCIRAVVHGCDQSEGAHRRCEEWAERWRDTTGSEPTWLLQCGSTSKCVFVTSEVYTGDLGGLAGADSKCQALAQGEGSLAAPGTYKAWLSAPGTGNSAAERLSHASVEYTRVDGVTIATDWADLTDGELNAPIDLDEASQQPPSDPWVWAGTDPAGGADVVSCQGWTSGDLASTGQVGSSAETDAEWTRLVDAPCGQVYHLYCLEQ